MNLVSQLHLISMSLRNKKQFTIRKKQQSYRTFGCYKNIRVINYKKTDIVGSF